MLPLVKFYNNEPISATILAAESSSKQSTTVVGSVILFYSNTPFKHSWIISLSVKQTVETTNKTNTVALLNINLLYYFIRLLSFVHIKEINNHFIYSLRTSIWSIWAVAK
jgi:hypothetical protein